MRIRNIRRFFFYVFMTFFVGMCSIAGFAGELEKIFEFEAVDGSEILGWFTVSEGEEITVMWGDGKSDSFAGRRTTFSKKYEEPYAGKVKVYAQNELSLREIIFIRGDISVSFNIEDIPPGLNHLDFHHVANTVGGDIADFPEGLTYFSCSGSNVITGNIKNLPDRITFFQCAGKNTIRGNIEDLPGRLSVFECGGENTITGDVKDLPGSLESFICGGKNTLTGDIADMGRDLRSFECTGENTISGNIAELPSGLESFRCDGSNSLYGDIANLPLGLNYLYVRGSNTFTGDIADIPDGMTYFRVYGLNMIDRYTAGRNWAKEMRHIQLVPGIGDGLRTAEIDNLLIDLAETSWARRGNIWLTGKNEPRSNASDSAVEKLKSMNVTIYTN